METLLYQANALKAAAMQGATVERPLILLIFTAAIITYIGIFTNAILLADLLI